MVTYANVNVTMSILFWKTVLYAESPRHRFILRGTRRRTDMENTGE